MPNVARRKPAKCVGDSRDRQAEQQKGDHRHQTGEILLENDLPWPQLGEEEQHQRIPLFFVGDPPAHQRRQEQKNPGKLRVNQRLEKLISFSEHPERIAGRTFEKLTFANAHDQKQQHAIGDSHPVSPAPGRLFGQLLLEQWKMKPASERGHKELRAAGRSRRYRRGALGEHALPDRSNPIATPSSLRSVS